MEFRAGVQKANKPLAVLGHVAEIIHLPIVAAVSGSQARTAVGTAIRHQRAAKSDTTTHIDREGEDGVRTDATEGTSSETGNEGTEVTMKSEEDGIGVRLTGNRVRLAILRMILNQEILDEEPHFSVEKLNNFGILLNFRMLEHNLFGT